MKAKGREAYLEQKNVDAKDFEEMLKQVDQYKSFTAKRQHIQDLKAESIDKINMIVASGDGHTRKEFQSIIETLSLCENAYGAIGNMVVIRYYLKEIDPHGLLLPEEIKDAQFELEMYLEAIAAEVGDWPARFLDTGPEEESKTETL